MIIALSVCVIAIALTVMYIMFATDKRIDALEDKFIDDSDTIDELCDVVNDNSKDIEDAVNGHADSLDTLEGFSNHLSLKINMIAEDVMSLENDLVETLKSVDDNRDNLHTTGEILEGMEDRMEELEENSLSDAERLSRLEEAMLENELEDIQLKEQVGDLKDNEEFIYDTLVSYMDGTDDTFKRMSKAIKYMSSAILTNWKAINDLSELIMKLNLKLEDVKAELDYCKEAVSEEIDNINTSVERIDVEMDYTERKLKEVDDFTVAIFDMYDKDKEKANLDALWKEVSKHYDGYKDAIGKRLPKEILDTEYELYMKYYDIAFKAQEEYDDQYGEDEE